ncbi:ATP-binding cassette domain-containing protein [Metabacillus fastidiosus]|uniref:ATP-binding cassette domain-containing protein n=1 Tax=Metabacillus fastidiosus TaxID=1458 RepID=A0ABU6P103_9BACI|nr:ATP-binding cassette domain-containing protein [Metabacillus fastidiosus]MED4403040.1 ATP-binding cassette domain-containing protein [Metabacillus fastidiosus]MED4533807.1 ATP-binding cassette domain-containing protein [Metabacillus fastidiosus]
MKEMMIETTNLTKKFKGKTVVDNINLSIKKGEIYGFLGPNGAGKTTTIRMLLGLMKPTNGKIELFGQDVKNNHIEALRKIGSLVESPSYYGHLTARENLEALRKILQVPKNRIDEVLSIVRLTNDANRPVKGFSLGMKQRLGIAAAILGNPELLILDEPTNGLDPSGIHEIRDLIKNMPKQYGITVLISSHLLSEIDQIATEVGIITKGKIIYQDSIEKLRNKARPKIAIKASEMDKAKALLLTKGILFEKQENRLISENANDEIVAKSISILASANISIYRVEEKRKSLEEIFLELTNGGGIGHAGGSAS